MSFIRIIAVGRRLRNERGPIGFHIGKEKAIPDQALNSTTKYNITLKERDVLHML